MLLEGKVDKIDVIIEALQEMNQITSEIVKEIKILKYYDYRKTRSSLPYVPANFWRNLYSDWREFEEIYHQESNPD